MSDTPENETPDFEEIKGVGPATADKLEDAGYETYRAIATESNGELANKADIGESSAADIIQAAREEADIGGFSSGTDVKERRKQIVKISLLSETFDELLGGGIETQAISEIYGEFGAGKSQLTHQYAVNVQIDEKFGGVTGRCVFIDTEDSFRPSRIDDMVRGLDDEILEHEAERRGIEGDLSDPDVMEALVDDFLDKIRVAKAFNVDHQILLAEKSEDICKEYQNDEWPVRLICVDSLTAHFRAEYVGRGELSRRQQKLNTHLHVLDGIADRYNASVIVTNQVQDDPNTMWGNPTKPIGGNILGHTSTFRMFIKNSKGNKRIIELNDAPNLPDGEAVVRVTNDGIKPE